MERLSAVNKLSSFSKHGLLPDDLFVNSDSNQAQEDNQTHPTRESYESTGSSFGDQQDADTSFRIRRNLLRRRHVRKEQKSQERAAAKQNRKGWEVRTRLEKSEGMILVNRTKRPMSSETSSETKRDFFFSTRSGDNRGLQHHQSSSSEDSIRTNHPALSSSEPICTPTTYDLTNNTETGSVTVTTVTRYMPLPEFSPVRPNKLRNVRRRIF